MIREIDHEIIDFSDVEEHTVTFDIDGVWYGKFVDDALIGVICIKDHYTTKKMISAVYIDHAYRKQGYAIELVEYCLNKYKEYEIYANALKASFNLFRKSGFVVYSIRDFKHGRQFRMRWKN